MSDPLRDYCDNMRELFLTEGWRLMVDELAGLDEQYSNVDAIATEQQLHFAKGVLFAARHISSLPDQVRDAEEDLADEVV